MNQVRLPFQFSSITGKLESMAMVGIGKIFLQRVAAADRRIINKDLR